METVVANGRTPRRPQTPGQSRDRLGPAAGASKAPDPARAARPSALAGPEAVAVAQVRGLRGRTDRDRHLILVTKGDLVRIAVKPFRSGIVGSARVGPALARRLARDSPFAVFLAALRGLRLAGLTGRLARLFDPVIVLDPAVIPRAGISLAWLLRFFAHHDGRLYRPFVRLFNVFGYGRLGNGSLGSGARGPLGSGTVDSVWSPSCELDVNEFSLTAVTPATANRIQVKVASMTARRMRALICE